MDELFEIMTLRQTGKMPFCPIVLMVPDYWRRLVDFEVMLEEGFIRPEDLDLFAYARNAEEAWSILERQGLTAPVP
jgi:predicted Rossmann-fold nucleotide-binding protein